MTGVAQLNATGEPLTDRQQRAALMVAEDERTDQAIADTIGINKVTLERWKKRPEFAAAVVEHREEFKNRALTEGFADKRARLKALDGLAQDIYRQIAVRGTPDDPTAGLYREEVKIASNGETVSYQVFDKPLVDTVRGLFDDIAREVGDRAANQPTVFQTLVSVVVGVEVDRL